MKQMKKSERDTQCYRYIETSYPRKTFILAYEHKAYELGIKNMDYQDDY